MYKYSNTDLKRRNMSTSMFSCLIVHSEKSLYGFLRFFFERKEGMQHTINTLGRGWKLHSTRVDIFSIKCKAGRAHGNGMGGAAPDPQHLA